MKEGWNQTSDAYQLKRIADTLADFLRLYRRQIYLTTQASIMAMANAIDESDPEAEMKMQGVMDMMTALKQAVEADLADQGDGNA